MKVLDRIALVLVIIGALNWGAVGLFRFDCVAAIFGARPWPSAVLSTHWWASPGYGASPCCSVTRPLKRRDMRYGKTPLGGLSISPGLFHHFHFLFYALAFLLSAPRFIAIAGCGKHPLIRLRQPLTHIAAKLLTGREFNKSLFVAQQIALVPALLRIRLCGKYAISTGVTAFRAEPGQR